MKTINARLALCIACALVAATAAANASPYVVTLEQVGSDVVATGSGEINLAGFPGSFLTSTASAAIRADPDYILLGTGELQGYGLSITGPSSFGSGSGTFADLSSGDAVGINGSNTIYLPDGYVSDTALSSSATWDSATFASLGVTPGTYVWTFGTGADQSITLDIVASTPLPAALPLFATGLGALGFLSRRKKRKAQAVVA